MSKPETFPLQIKRGSAVARIYRTPGAKYDGYTVELYVDGQRQRYFRSKLDKARKLATEKLDLINDGDTAVLRLDAGDLAQLTRVKQLLAPTGKTFETVAAEYRQIWEICRDADPLEACRFYMEKRPRPSASKTVSELVAELIAAKEQDQLSAAYLTALNQYLKGFKKQFEGDISAITGQDIDKWLRGLNVSPRSRNNYRLYIHTLFNFAKTRGYLPNTWDEMSAVSKAKARIEKITIFSPDELSRLIADASDDELPFLVLGAFAGIRHEEIKRLEWSNIRWDSRYIEVNAESAKIGTRRLVPITDNLLQWLLPYRPRSGRICPFGNMSAQISRLVESTQRKDAEGNLIPESGVKWKKNALRHSFISYRLADTKHIGQVAEEAGNSPQKIKTNYRELVTEAEAKRWFGIVPGRAKEIPQDELDQAADS